MSEDQKKKIREGSLNKALEIAYFGLLEFAKNTNLQIDEKKIRFESIKPDKENEWKVVLSYILNPTEEPKNAFEVMENSRRYFQTFSIDLGKGEIIETHSDEES